MAVIDQNVTEGKKGVLHKNKLFVCSIFVLFGLCIIGLIAGAAVWLGWEGNAGPANTTETVIAQTTEQAGYEFIDPFDNNTYRWLADSINNEYMVGSITIEGGTYNWDVREVKQPFFYWTEFYLGDTFKDFDIYVDTKIAETELGGTCSGFIFRKPSYKLDEGAYLFSVCSDSSLYVFHLKQGETDLIKVRVFSRTFIQDDWNHLEISARGDHFVFLVNYKVVFEITDDRQPIGGIALIIDKRTLDPATIWFDNFGFQRR